jgi:hypothetical protein
MLHIVQRALNLSCEQADDALLLAVVLCGVLSGRYFFGALKRPQKQTAVA